jgi:hypothetical protein
VHAWLLHLHPQVKGGEVNIARMLALLGLTAFIMTMTIVMVVLVVRAIRLSRK